MHWVVVELLAVIRAAFIVNPVIHTTFGDYLSGPREIPSFPNKRPVTGPSMK